MSSHSGYMPAQMRFPFLSIVAPGVAYSAKRLGISLGASIYAAGQFDQNFR